MHWYFKGRKTFYERLELQRFPFDYQELSFEVAMNVPTLRGPGDTGPCVWLQPPPRPRLQDMDRQPVHLSGGWE